MKKIASLSIATLAIGLFCTPSFADIYKYRDPNGVIHFTNIPQGKDYEKIISEKRAQTKGDYDYIIESKSSKYNIEPAIIRAVITAESNWDPRAVSHKGAIGLMQLMPDTAKDMEISNPFDPEDNIEGGTRYLRWLLNKFDGNLDLALAAYNAGPTRVEQSGGIPAITETRKYVQNVNKIYKGSSPKKEARIYKITYSDGTVLYTNTPSDNQNTLSNF